METLDYFKLLSYGATGLGCILAFLTYRLLLREQERSDPRGAMLRAIYVFMAFSLILTVCGFGAELVRQTTNQANQAMVDKIAALQGELAKQTNATAALEQKNGQNSQKVIQQNQTIDTIRKVIATLIDVKSGKVKQLAKLSPSNPGYVTLIQEVQSDLDNIDNAIRNSLESN